MAYGFSTVFIGTTTGTNPGISLATGGAINIGNSAGGAGWGFCNFYRSGVLMGTIGQNGTTGVLYTTSSDYRLKENINPIGQALAKINLLKPSEYNFISDPGEKQTGFIAHELQEIIPEAVNGQKDEMEDIGDVIKDDDGVVVSTDNPRPLEEHEGQTWVKTGERPKYQGVDQSKIVPYLVAAIKELTEKVANLEALVQQAG
jgi:hypothetical protein